MMISKKILLSILMFIQLGAGPLFAMSKGREEKNWFLENTYRHAQREFLKKNYSKALTQFKIYLKRGSGKLNKKERLFWVLDQVGYIYLRVNKDPDEAINFYQDYLKDPRLSEAEQTAIEEWISAAQDWKKEKISLGKKVSANDLYKAGKKYFDQGLQKKLFPMDDKGNADFAIAESYLIPFLVRHDSDPKIGSALLMMGRIKMNLRTDLNYWAESHYLKETIRRFPNTGLSMQAWEKLREDLKSGYSGNSGSPLPDSVKEMLNVYKKVAQPKKTKKKI